MSGAHVPVLAGELLALIEPGPGETAVDCTFGAGGHARIVSERLGGTGTLVCIDRHPAAEAHFAALGEEPNARQIAREIVRRRQRAPIETTGELVEAIELALPAAVRHRFGSGHPARRVFQALRIAVNDELEQLDRALPAGWELLRPGGRLAAISFHSLEDRRVKRFMAERARGCVCPPEFPVCACGRTPEAELLTQRAVAPTPGEVAHNPRAASGKLRVARKLEVDA